jgi:hypothetical protein
MARFEIGQPIRVNGSPLTGPPYDRKAIYVVSSVDPNDSTLRATDDAGRELGWVKWHYCRVAESTLFSLIAADLPEDVLLFLACFDGIGTLELKEQVMDAILEKVPDLPARIVAYARTETGASAVSSNMPPKPSQPKGGAAS